MDLVSNVSNLYDMGDDLYDMVDDNADDINNQKVKSSYFIPHEYMKIRIGVLGKYRRFDSRCYRSM